MNLEQTLVANGLATASVSKEQDMATQHLLSDDPGTFTASYGVAQDSLHWGLMEITPKQTVPVVNPGDPADKKRRKSKNFRKYEADLIRQQDVGPRRTMVQTIGVSNEDIMNPGMHNVFASKK